MKYQLRKLDEGTEGIIIQIGNYVMKLYKKGYYPNIKVNEKLKEIDFNHKYFMWYNIINKSIVLMNKLKKLKNPKKLTKEQYRHLQSGINLLSKYNISHGDLPDNIMLDENNLPIIIDFDKGKINASKKDLEIDRIAFLSHFSRI